jgi:hypothetical protein
MVIMNEQSSPNAAAVDIPRGQPATAQSPARGRTFRRLWRRSVLGAVVAAASLAAVTFGAGAAHADTLPNGSLVQLGQYSIPATPAAGATDGDAVPVYPGTLGNPTELFMNQAGTSSQVLSVKGGSSAWGTPVETETAAGGAGQIWRLQLVGWVAMLTNTSNVIPIVSPLNPSGLLQKMPVYKIINYHSDGTHTCLDGVGNDPAVGSAVDSYGCDPNQVNQINELWVVANTTMQATMMDWQGQTYTVMVHGQPGAPQFNEWLTGDLQDSPYKNILTVYGDSNTVIENLATIQASGGDTTQAPVLSAGYGSLTGVNSPVGLMAQQWPVSQANSAWLIHDTTPGKNQPPTGSDPNPPQCSMFACLFS